MLFSASALLDFPALICYNERAFDMQNGSCPRQWAVKREGSAGPGNMGEWSMGRSGGAPLGVNRRIVLAFLLHILFSLGIGLAYYLLYRPEARVTQLFCGVFHCAARVPQAREGALWRCLHGHLADFLWAYALTFTLRLITLPFPRLRRFSLCMCLLADIGMELIQLFPGVSGVFDPWDILAQLLATGLAEGIILRMTKGERKHVTEPE